MLDSIRERTHGWMAKVILALITIPFALFGIDSYLNNRGGDTAVATVNGDKISRQAFDRAIKDQQNELAASMGASFDPAILDDPKVRQSILDDLIKQQLLIGTAHKVGMLISDAQLAKFIGAIPAFQENGQFSDARYEQLLRQQGMTITGFEQRVRQELLMNDMRAAFSQSAIMPSSVTKTFTAAFDQQREISLFKINPAEFAQQIKVTPAEIKTYYDAHQSEFSVPAQGKFQYAVLSLDDMAKQIPVDDATLKQYYDQNIAKYSEPEQRQARHILIAVSPTDSAQKRAEAKAKAEQLYKQVSAAPASFAALAKQNSNDPGSAAQGGDLGWFPRNAMVKPFADAVFGMKQGEIQGPIATDFGYHIIQLTGIKPAQARSFDAVKADIKVELEKQQAGKRFADAAEQFSNQVYEQSTELQSVANAMGIKLATSDWVSQKGGASAGILNSPKMLQALFSDDVLKNKRNSEAIEVAPNVLVSARLVEYKPAGVRPFAEASAAITQLITQQQTRALVQKQGEAMLAQLRAGKEPAGLHWSAFQLVSRSHADNVAATLIEGIFAADEKALPAYVGAMGSDGGYQLVRITRVQPGTDSDPLKLKAMQVQLSNIVTQQAFSDYLAGLSRAAKIDIKANAMEKTAQ
ncbi:MAG: SurA N-terminal domain-containing protein [Sulfuriferula sp.]|nr:SurA N-terminal domain-containing protein [Sulfuriferula sp.]